MLFQFTIQCCDLDDLLLLSIAFSLWVAGFATGLVVTMAHFHGLPGYGPKKEAKDEPIAP